MRRERINWGRKRSTKAFFSRGYIGTLSVRSCGWVVSVPNVFGGHLQKVVVLFAKFLVFLEIVVVEHIARAAANSELRLGLLQDAAG